MIETSKTQADIKDKYSKGGGRSLIDKSKPTKLVSLYEARKQWSAAGYQLVSRAERKRRFAICKTCDSFSSGQCGECGCFMRIKSLLSGMTCKLNEW